MKYDGHWGWAAYGKHPLAGDYIRIGQDFPLMKSFSGWVEKGFDRISAMRKKGYHGANSWRFWARGTGKDTIVCGLVKDSSDSLGRPYPFLVMGTGPLRDWENQWDLLPMACEKTWGQIEYLSAQIFDDFKNLESEIQNLRPPYPEWTALNEKREHLFELGETSDHKNSTRVFEDQESMASSFMGKTERLIHLDQGSFDDQMSLISSWHFMVKTHGEAFPHATFMGGTFDRAYLAFYIRPLVSDDFIRLWSLCSPEVRNNGSFIVR